MSTITISETTPNPPIRMDDDATAVLRGYYSQRFLDSDGVTVVMQGNGQSGFYYEVPCSVDPDGNLVIGEFVIHTTDDGIDVATSLFTGQLYINGAPDVIIFGFASGSGWIIPVSLGDETTWGELDVFNQGRALVLGAVSYTYLTAAMTAALIAQMIDAAINNDPRIQYYSEAALAFLAATNSAEQLVAMTISATTDEINKLSGAGEIVASGTEQPHVDDPVGGSTIDLEARTAINEIIDSLEAFGITATS